MIQYSFDNAPSSRYRMPYKMRLNYRPKYDGVRTGLSCAAFFIANIFRLRILLVVCREAGPYWVVGIRYLVQPRVPTPLLVISRSISTEEKGGATLSRKLHNPSRAVVAFDHAATPGEEVVEAEHRRHSTRKSASPSPKAESRHSSSSAMDLARNTAPADSTRAHQRGHHSSTSHHQEENTPPADSTRTHERGHHSATLHHGEGNSAASTSRRSRSLSPSVPSERERNGVTKLGRGEGSDNQRKHIGEAEVGERVAAHPSSPRSTSHNHHHRDSSTGKSDDGGGHRHHHRSSPSSSVGTSSPTVRDSRRSRHDGEDQESVKSNPAAHRHHHGHTHSTTSDDGASAVGHHGESIPSTSRSPTSRRAQPSTRSGSQERQYNSDDARTTRSLRSLRRSHDSSDHSEAGSSRLHGKGYGGSTIDASNPQRHSSSRHRDKASEDRSMSPGKGTAAREGHHSHSSGTERRHVEREEGCSSPTSSVRHHRSDSRQRHDHSPSSTGDSSTVVTGAEHAQPTSAASSISRSPSEHRHGHRRSTDSHHEDTTNKDEARHPHRDSSDKHHQREDGSETFTSNHDARAKHRSGHHQQHSAEYDPGVDEPPSTDSRLEHKTSSDRGRSHTSAEGDEGRHPARQSKLRGHSSENPHGHASSSGSPRNRELHSEGHPRSPRHRQHSGRSSGVPGSGAENGGHRSDGSSHHTPSGSDNYPRHNGSKIRGGDSQDGSASVTEGSRHKLDDEERENRSEHGSTSSSSSRHRHSTSSSISSSSRHGHDHHSPRRGDEGDRGRHRESDRPEHHRSDHRPSSHHGIDKHRAPHDEGIDQRVSYTTRSEAALEGREHHHRSSRGGRSESPRPRYEISGSRPAIDDNDGGSRDEREKASRHRSSSPSTQHDVDDDRSREGRRLGHSARERHDDRSLSPSSDGAYHRRHGHESAERSRSSYASLHVDTTRGRTSAIGGGSGSRGLESSLGRSEGGARVGR